MERSSDSGFVVREVDGHAPQTEHVRGGWKATCPCGFEGKLRDHPDKANEDRFKHEHEIGMKVETKLDLAALREQRDRELLERLRSLMESDS